MSIALVTGGSRGLGKNMALSLAKKGIDVILTYHSKADEAQAVVAEIEQLGAKAAALPLDTAHVAGFESFVQQFKQVLADTFGQERFNFLINNAGVGVYTPIGNTKEEDVDQLVNVHFKGVIFLTQHLLPLLTDGGRIINISSGLTRFSNPGYAVYASLKTAIETLSRYMAKELGSRGIAVNVVAPGAIETDFGGGAVRDNAQINQQIASATALGRVGLPDDIGGVVAFLCTEEARWINAQRIEVSGGMNL
ncbi:SDR family NAD(P)-dependent oxidoreductase [Siphonobacter curvatus]|uniref:Short-chain dehydrogenase n=1 Tax=Siphonobacter curvatus TaxID=2094562 RepID=A0A2S7IHF1_9BACT|nr:SDR family oxidoreductase [Siphonobacter curvatus]PQA55088.1 short-chain dehydrogenase [Siphonobacter curvatus]